MKRRIIQLVTTIISAVFLVVILEDAVLAFLATMAINIPLVIIMGHYELKEENEK